MAYTVVTFIFNGTLLQLVFSSDGARSAFSEITALKEFQQNFVIFNLIY